MNVLASHSRSLAPWVLLSCLLLGGSTPAAPAASTPGQPESLTVVLDLPADTLELIQDGGFVRPDMRGMRSLGEPGRPAMPVRRFNVILPRGTSLAGLEVLRADWKRLPGTYRIVPDVEPRIVGSDDEPLPVPDPAVYESPGTFPEWVVRVVGDGFLRGAHLAALDVVGARWTPTTGELEVLSRIELRPTLVPGTAHGRMPGLTGTTHGVKDEIATLKRNVANDEQVPLALPDYREEPLEDVPVYQPPPPYPTYVIIAPAAGGMADEAMKLAEWLTRSGVPADVVTVEWIFAHYGSANDPPPDGPEMVRDFIVEAYEHYGIEYVFLVGDFDEVPTREFRGSSGSDPVLILHPTDFYYSDLDGTHNMDGDDIWFERYEDYPAGYAFYEDVHVGRIPAKNAQMVVDYLAKYFSYIRAVESGYQTDILYAGDDVYGCSSTVTKFETLIDPIVNHPPYGVAKLYCGEWPDIPEWYPLTIGNFIQFVSEGQDLILHAAHSGYFGMGMGDGLFQNGIYGPDHVAMLTNLDRYGAMYSLGCSVQPWDYDHAIGEDLVMDPGRGLIASVANSDVGWWPTQMYNLRDFAQSAIGDETVPISQNMIDAKQTNTWWWNGNGGFYSLWGKGSVNLLGEPSLEIWTDHPAGLLADSKVVPTAPNQWQVIVKVTESPSPTPVPPPVANARVCLSGGGVYEVGHTDANGQVTFLVTNSSSKVLGVVTTARNHMPFEGKVPLK